MPTRRRFLGGAAAALLTSTSKQSCAQDEEPNADIHLRPKLPSSVAALPDRRAEATPIALQERESRLERARSLMQVNRLDALVLCTGASLAYFTGLHWEQSERFFAWVLPVRSAPFVICPAFEKARVRERMEAKPATLPAASITRVYTWNEHESPYLLLARALKEAGLVTGRLGLDANTHFSFADRLARAVPAVSVRSGTPVTEGCRSLKSSAELALMRLANVTTLSVYEAVYKALQPGMTSREVSELIESAYQRSGFRGEASCQVGPNSASPHGTLQPQVLREGEVILIDDGCTVEGYQSDISRSFVLGRATDKQKKIFKIVHRAQVAALAAARPGTACSTIDDAARNIITNAGYGPAYTYFTHRVGHGIGMDGHEAPYLVGGNRTTLAPGMCFSDEPGIYIPHEFGIRLEDDWYMTDAGGQFFTPTSPSLEAPFARS